jgi:hypothetical protein
VDDRRFHVFFAVKDRRGNDASRLHRRIGVLRRWTDERVHVFEMFGRCHDGTAVDEYANEN